MSVATKYADRRSRVDASREVMIIDSIRSPIGRRGGALSTMHSADLLAAVLRAVLDQSGLQPDHVDQVIGGCVGQVGMQSHNVTRTAWLTAGLPIDAAATTVDSQCGSSQQAVSLIAGLIASGTIEIGVACGVESMSQVPMGAGLARGLDFGRAIPKSYFPQHEFTTQFEAAERIADKWGITRTECDALGFESQARAAKAWADHRFDSQLAPIDVPELDPDGAPTGSTISVTNDGTLRDTTMEGLANLKPVAREAGVHTAGSASQIADGASAVILASRETTEALGLSPKARIVDSCMVGVDPVMMLTGPVDATQRLLIRNGMTIDDLDVIEINEAFASVVLAWQRELGADMDRVNPNGGAIAMGHPLGASGCLLTTKAVHELVRSNSTMALVTMCCGGGLGTGTIIERV